jgi:hypothetical protein
MTQSAQLACPVMRARQASMPCRQGGRARKDLSSPDRHLPSQHDLLVHGDPVNLKDLVRKIEAGGGSLHGGRYPSWRRTYGSHCGTSRCVSGRRQLHQSVTDGAIWRPLLPLPINIVMLVPPVWDGGGDLLNARVLSRQPQGSLYSCA